MKHCNNYRIIVSSFVLVDLDPRFKILNRSDKRMLWSLMTVSLWFFSFSFSPRFCLFCLFAFLSLSVPFCVSWVEVSFVFGPDISPTSYWCFFYTAGIQTSVCSFSIDLLQDIPFSVFCSRGSKVMMDSCRVKISFSFFLSFPLFLTYMCLSSTVCFSALLVFLSHMLR